MAGLPSGVARCYRSPIRFGWVTSMWPHDPDDFESLAQVPEGQSHDDAWYFVIVGQEILCVSENGSPRPILADEMRWIEIERHAEIFLGRYQGRSCFAVVASGRAPQGYTLLNLRAWLGRVAPPVFYLAGRAQQLADWERDHRFCGRCGTNMENHSVDRAKQCPGCGLINYPRLSPSIIVLIRKGEEMLLARNANWPRGMYSTLAGFVEPGESIEQTVHREVLEEVGLRVKNVRYLGSQSWPFPNSLMLGFHADYAGGDIVCQEGEIADAKWFHYSDLPGVPPGTAISRWLIDHFIDEMTNRSA
jgi:NAD+ diphosphatase